MKINVTLSITWNRNTKITLPLKNKRVFANGGFKLETYLYMLIVYYIQVYLYILVILTNNTRKTLDMIIN